MTYCNSFQIIFEEPNKETYSATFDVAIGLECRGKYVDVKGKVYDMSNYNRIVHPDSTSLNVIHKAHTTKTIQTTCYGKQQAIADDDWCTRNCTAPGTPFCPSNYCSCTTYIVNPGEKCSLPVGSQTPWKTIPVLDMDVISVKKICDQDPDGCNCIYQDMSSPQAENWRYHLYRNSPGTDPGDTRTDVSWFKKLSK